MLSCGNKRAGRQNVHYKFLSGHVFKNPYAAIKNKIKRGKKRGGKNAIGLAATSERERGKRSHDSPRGISRI